MWILKIIILVSLSFMPLQYSRASSEKEFIMSCTYGVLAGTLVGAASLAFVDKPGDNLQHVARGASLGLYMGIGLGLYTAYILPGQLEKEEEQKIEQETSEEASLHKRFILVPVFANNFKLDGFGALVQIANF